MLRKKALQNEVLDFTTKVGTFFATECQMGALIKSTFKSTMSKNDTFDGCKQSLALTLKGDDGGLSPSFKNETITTKDDSKKQIDCSCRALGGDVTIFAEKPGAGENTSKGNARIRNKWAKTIPEHMVGFNFKLVPIWTLVEDINKTFAQDLQRELSAMWRVE